jgi:ATP-binding cassette subfamily C protein CydD
MRPLDPRLLRYASAARWFLLVGAALGLAQTLVVVAFAWLLSRAISLAALGRGPAELAPTIGALARMTAARAALVWLLEVAASRGAASVKSQLRARVLQRLAERGPDWLAGRQSAGVATLVGQGLDALDNYFARYLPQLLLAGIATPIIVLVMLWQDLPSGITVIVVLPFIPLFMVLIGQATQAVQRAQWDALQRLGVGFLDLVGGLATLKIFGREGRQADRVRAITEDYRGRTMKVLRVSFLSGFVLELGASLSVALVAVSVGLRLVDGSLQLGVGLFVLLLAPEAFLPVRQVGAQFHAAADGLAVAEDVFAILDAEPAEPAEPGSPLPSPQGVAVAALRFDRVSVHRSAVGPAPELSTVFLPGRLTVIRGASGAGKSSLIAALAGFVPFDGAISLGRMAVTTGTARPWLAWAGQRPGLLAGTIADNIALGESAADPALVRRSLRDAGAGDLDPETRLGVNGDGLSGGQAQRVAAARAIYRTRLHGCSVLVLDEPSSALDPEAELHLVSGLRGLAAEGHIVIVVSHRPVLRGAADQVVDLGETAHV